MPVTIDEAQQFIISALQENLHSSKLSRNIYDVHLDTAATQYINLTKKPPEVYEQTYQSMEQKNEITAYRSSCYRSFSDALWDLCRKSILRPGENYLTSYSSPIQTINEGYSVTEYGKNWLSSFDNASFVPADPNRFSQLFCTFQLLFGESYARRAKEAVSSMQANNFLACCAMCGAAAESILLSSAFTIITKEEVLRKYFSRSGRSNIEKMVFEKTPKHINNKYKAYTQIISYWRDESAHGHESNIDVNEAYIALLTLLRFAEFMRDNLRTIQQSYLAPSNTTS